MFLPDEVIVAVQGDPRAEVSVHEVGRLGENLKSIADKRSEQDGAVPSSNADVIWIDREGD